MSNPNPPKNRKRHGVQVRPSQKLAEQREQEIEAALLRRLPPHQIAVAMAKRWGTSERTAWNYMAKVRARWVNEAGREATTDGRVEVRAHMRASLNDVYAKAMGRRAPVLDSTGAPVMDPKTGQPLTVERPDLGKAIQVARLIVDLDALQAPPPVQQIAVQATVAAAVSKTDAAGLAAFLTRGAAQKPQ